MKRVLFLDDDPERHAVIKARRPNDAVVTIDDLDEWGRALLEDGPWDEIWLDHDLNDWVKKNKMPDGRQLNGQDAAWHIAVYLKPPAKIVIHSWNDTGAALMADILRPFNPVVEPFDINHPCGKCGGPATWLRSLKKFHCNACDLCASCGCAVEFLYGTYCFRCEGEEETGS